MQRILAHHEQREPGTILWARGLRACLGGPSATVRNPKTAGALRALWSGSLWTKVRLAAHNKVGESRCRACQSDGETIGH
eukprot:5113993-Pyramimonas_sp.AAC.1